MARRIIVAANREFATAPARLFVWRQSRRAVAAADGIRQMNTKNPFGGLVAGLGAGEFDMLRSAVDERRCRGALGYGTLAEAAALSRPDPPCPSCSAPGAARDGTSASGLRKYRCRACGAKFNSLTGTVFEGCKKDLPAWASFVELMCWNVPVEAAAEIVGISHKTAFEWRHRVFAAVSGYQDRLVLSGRVWLDETYVVDTDLSHGYGQARKRGLSSQKLCVVVAIDERKTVVAKVCGHGKPSSARIRDVMLPHLAEGSTVVHDMEKSHAALVRATGCRSEAYRADVRDPAYLECMALVNNLCSWLKRNLWRFTGMDPGNLQLYLDWYVYLFRVNQAKDRWPKVERVLRHLMMADARYRSLG